MLLFYFATFLSCLAVVKTMAETSKASIKSTETMRDSNDCYTPSTHINMMECENGNVGEKWGGCTDQDSVRVRCPKGTMPCNGLTNDKKEFRCMENCDKYKRDGGERTCLEKDFVSPECYGLKDLPNFDKIVDKTGYIDYLPGDEESKIILTAPHGGMYPNWKRDRVNFVEKEGGLETRVAGCKLGIGKEGANWKGCVYKPNSSNFDCEESKICKVETNADMYTKEILEYARDEIARQMNGIRPHAIINKLRRSRMDPNLDIVGAAQGNELGIRVYKEFHAAINLAKQKVERGLLLDFHLQAHKNNAIELGYVISTSDLNDNNIDVNETGFRALAKRKTLKKDFVVGDKSLGYFFEVAGYLAVPSLEHKSPDELYDKTQPEFEGERKYFNGGLITRCHGSLFGGEIDAVQMEFPNELLPKELPDIKSENIKKLGKATGKVIAEFYEAWYM